MPFCSGPVCGVSIVLYVKVGTSTLGKTAVSAVTTVCAPPSTSPKDFNDEWTMTGAVPRCSSRKPSKRSRRRTAISTAQLQDMPDHVAGLFRLDVINPDTGLG